MYISFIAIPNIISSAYLSYYTIGMVQNSVVKVSQGKFTKGQLRSFARVQLPKCPSNERLSSK